MSEPVICAAAGCANPVVRTPGQLGRPPIYCSAGCRASRARPGIVVEVDQDAGNEDQPGRDWVVRIRRGPHVVVVGRGLGRFSATAFASELGFVLGGGPTHRGDEQ
jgi:hypothetical protein